MVVRSTFGLIVLTLALTAVVGCASVPVNLPSLKVASTEEGNLNPLYVETENANYLWEGVIDVLDNYFPVTYERPVFKLDHATPGGAVLSTWTEGRVDTEPVIAAGVLQPWRKNSVTISQRMEATFQTIRRKAVVRIVPVEKGFLIHLAVYNEIENLPNPMNSTMSGTNLTFSEDMSQLTLPTGDAAQNDGWIPYGRNEEFEQYILQEIAWRLNNPPTLENPRSTRQQTAQLVP